jgi:iron-sulfur cluster assembly protein
MSYVLGYDRRREHDLEFEENGVSVLMDRRQGLYLLGAVVDYHDGLDARGFGFENPNATQKCGCGSSFSA